MRMLILIGTSHVYQRPPRTRREESGQLVKFLVRAARKFEVGIVGEELAEEDLAGRGLIRSTCADVAETLSIPHIYCNPNAAERVVLGIPDGPSGYRRREEEWMRRIVESGKWPVLFVCGATHVANFKKLLLENGIEVKVLRRDWAPELSQLSPDSVVFGGKA
jgi:hypothetical protein